MAKSNVSSKDNSRQEDSPDGFEVHMEEMSKMKYVDFRKEASQVFRDIQDTMIENIEWNAEQRGVILSALKDAFKERDKILDIARDRIENLEKILFVYFLGNEKTEAKELASMFNINWEKTAQELKTLQEATGGEV